MKICLVEDHDETLRLWRQEGVRKADLVHLDAHIDFNIQYARPPAELLAQASSIQELKTRLEYAIAFSHFEADLDKQTDMGNYIYPAIQEDIVRDFYWVIPGDAEEFTRSRGLAAKMLQSTLRREYPRAAVSADVKRARISARYNNRDIIICCLESLPGMRGNILLDIDTDFLVTESIRVADNTQAIGRRKPWILPEELVRALNRKLPRPRMLTIAYSVNGGFTPAKYRHLADATAFHFAPSRFRSRFERAAKAAEHFSRFEERGETRSYQRAVRLDAHYRCPDNNCGRLYLLAGKPAQALREFRRIMKADPHHPGALEGLGEIALRRRDFAGAKAHFTEALRRGRTSLFQGVRAESLLGLARACFGLKQYRIARKLLLRYVALKPLEPWPYCLLGDVYRREDRFIEAAQAYKDALRTGFIGLRPLLGLAAAAQKDERLDMRGYLSEKYQAARRAFPEEKMLRLKRLIDKLSPTGGM